MSSQLRLRPGILPLRQLPHGVTSTWSICQVYVFCNINQPNLSTPFPLTCAYFCLFGPFNYISFHKLSQQFSAFSHCSSDLVSAFFGPFNCHFKAGVGLYNYNHTCYAYCQEFLSCLFLPFPSIHLHLFPKPLKIFFFFFFSFLLFFQPVYIPRALNTEIFHSAG